MPVRIIGDIKPRQNLADIITHALSSNSLALNDNDIVVIAQKVVSKAEGRLVNIRGVVPSKRALKLAKALHKDPRIVELVLRESREVVKTQNRIIITETRHGFVCANSGVDQSNLADSNSVALLPQEPDLSARRLRTALRKKTGKDVAVIITDTFGRPFREGQVNVAIGIAGMKAIKSYIGKKDMFGRRLHVTELAVADEVASAAELVMNKSDGVPVAIVRGLKFEKNSRASAKSLVRHKKNDLFRS